MPKYGEMMTLYAWMWTMALNAWTVNKSWQLWMPKLWTMASNAKLWATGSKFQTIEKWWLCMPECGRWLWTPELWINHDGSECQTVNDGSKRQIGNRWWLWTPKLRMWHLNVKLGSDDGSKRWNWECESERQTEKWWLWTPKLRSDDGSERRNWECDENGSDRRNWEAVMALNAETDKRWWWIWTPKLKNATLNIKLKIDDGYKCQKWECDSERQTKKWWWLWTSKLRTRL